MPCRAPRSTPRASSASARVASSIAVSSVRVMNATSSRSRRSIRATHARVSSADDTRRARSSAAASCIGRRATSSMARWYERVSSRDVSDRSFVRFGGLAGILLAITSWAAVILYYTAAAGGQDLVGLETFRLLYALTAFWALFGIVAVHWVVRSQGEAWSFFAALVGVVASSGTTASSPYQVAATRTFLVDSPGRPLADRSAQPHDLRAHRPLVPHREPAALACALPASARRARLRRRRGPPRGIPRCALRAGRSGHARGRRRGCGGRSALLALARDRPAPPRVTVGGCVARRAPRHRPDRRLAELVLGAAARALA